MSDLRKEFATALRYEPGSDNAPVVVAAGQGLQAKRIKEIAEKTGVPLYQDQALAKTLYGLGIGAEIPPQLYEAVAKILVFVAKLDKKS
ncbi:EscU/YscU/HrcU family type III secretion system export apparatus switch protein [Pelotomaculum propionicicum]|uniref:EscU/YscU/HrcU family type III secretion system export apparatus switch protein n=1 Tax=Pelotomaculum propionicicum TaxID=258475 RepID=UPI003B76FB81